MSITYESGGPPEKREGPADDRGQLNNQPKLLPRGNHSTQLRRRRAGSWRIVGGDPWRYSAPTAGYEAAIEHLLQLGLLPAPDRDALRQMYRRGGCQRQAATLVAERWELVT